MLPSIPIDANDKYACCYCNCITKYYELNLCVRSASHGGNKNLDVLQNFNFGLDNINPVVSNAIDKTACELNLKSNAIFNGAARLISKRFYNWRFICNK